jgi:hypothetical protein
MKATDRAMKAIAEASVSLVPPRSPLNLSLPVIAGLAGLLLPLLRPSSSLIDPDTYLHLAVGRWMLDHGALPFRDPFSGSMPGAPWVPHEWVAEMLFAALYILGGWGALMLATTACYGFSLWLFTRRLLTRCEPFTVLIVVTLTGFMVYRHLLVRPHVLVFPILVAWSAALIECRDSDRAPSLWLLPLMVLWSNLHGSFLFGLALGLYLGAEAVLCARNAAIRRQSLRQWGLFLVLGTLAGFATPNGLDGVLHPFLLLAQPTSMATFTEWLPPDLREDRLMEIWILGAMALGLGLGLKLPLTRLVLLLGLYYEVFQSIRHLDLLCWVGPLAVAAALGPQLAALIRAEHPSGLAKWMERRAGPSDRRGIGIAALLALLLGLGTALYPPQPIDAATYPVAAVAAARAMQVSGPVLNEESFGGYLVYMGIAPFIDGRIEMYGDAFLARWARAERGNREVMTGLLDRYHITWTLFPPDSGAVQILDILPGWRRAYSDHTAVIHVRVDP